MRADNAHHLITAARRRSKTTLDRAVTTLRRMDNTGTTITFGTVAQQAGVSRAWLYNQPEIRAEIERLRERRHPTTRPTIPDRQRASDASLRQRLETAIGRTRDLEVDNRRLRAALAEALGDNRARPETQSTPRPRRHTTPTAVEQPQAVNIG